MSGRESNDDGSELSIREDISEWLIVAVILLGRKDYAVDRQGEWV